MTQSLLRPNHIQLAYPWLLGGRSDLVYFFLPSFVAFAMYAYSFFNTQWLQTIAPLVVFAYAGNVIHQAATWYHYLDKRNREYYFGSTKQRLKFIAAPILVMAASIGLAFQYPAVVAGVYVLWSVPHFFQQNIGILLLYHNAKAGEAVVDRRLEVLTQRLSALFFSLLFYHRLVLCKSALGTASSALLLVLLAASVVTCVLYLWQLYVQVRNGAVLNVPALLFWAVSVLFFMPLGFIGNDFGFSFLLPSLLHWIQYIGLNLIMYQRKYSEPEQAKFLVWNKPMLLFTVFCSAILLVQFGSFFVLSTQYMQSYSWWNCVFLGLGMVHYLLDGFIWKFREPYNRQAMLPYLVHRD